MISFVAKPTVVELPHQHGLLSDIRVDLVWGRKLSTSPRLHTSSCTFVFLNILSPREVLNIQLLSAPWKLFIVNFITIHTDNYYVSTSGIFTEFFFNAEGGNWYCRMISLLGRQSNSRATTPALFFSRDCCEPIRLSSEGLSRPLLHVHFFIH